MNPLIAGALAGLAATAPMTLAMKAMHRYLLEGERYPLPPRLITERVVEEAGAAESLNEETHRLLALAAHFAYGAAAGAVYAPLAERMGCSPMVGGALYGLTVWAGSYLGLLPAAGILRPATRHPARRTALMIAAHVVWGATTGALLGRGRNSKRG
ncbi:MAG TPA: DUF1440 domain-containing protein [Blastocatellia bacterium]